MNQSAIAKKLLYKAKFFKKDGIQQDSKRMIMLPEQKLDVRQKKLHWINGKFYTFILLKHYKM